VHKPILKFQHILKWLMIEVIFGRAHYAISREMSRSDRTATRKAMPLTRDAHADCAQMAAARIFDRASDVSFHTLLSAALKEAGTFRYGNASEVRKLVGDAKATLVRLQPAIDALLVRRNQTQAHTDARPIIEPEKYVKDGQISYGRIDELFEQVALTLNRFSFLYFGKAAPLPSEFVRTYRDTLTLLEQALSKAAKLRPM
jgi:hypothetical protein